MIPGAPREARWRRAEPRRSLPEGLIECILREALPGRRALHREPLSGGMRNANFKILLDGPPDAVVLRIYEHDPSLLEKETAIFQRLQDAVPVPEVLHAEPRGIEGSPPFTVTRFLGGITFHELKHTANRDAVAQAARSAGATLAAIGCLRFSSAGWLGPHLAVGDPLLAGRDPVPRFVDLCLAQPLLQQRVPADWRARAHHLVWHWAPRLAEIDSDPRLVHGDFNRRNLLVECAAGRWQVSGILDWEFAVAGSPLADLGSFLRYEEPSAPLVEPYFSEGYRSAGGELPEDWRRLARLLSLAALAESLTHEDLPDPIARELVQLFIAHGAAR